MCWFHRPKVSENFLQCVQTQGNISETGGQVRTDVKYAESYKLIANYFFFPHWSAACVQVCALNCTILLCVGSDGGDKLSETRQEERVIRMGSRFLKMAGTDSHISAPCLFVFWLRKVLFASLDRVRTDCYHSHINLFNRQETVVETFFFLNFNTTCSCS